MDLAKPSVRERLLAAADELFYREGVHTVGIDRILEHAEVAKASLYGTFGSKEELVRAYLQHRARQLEQRIEAYISTIEDPRERILAVFDGYGERVAEPDYVGCAFARACAENPREPGAAHDVTLAHRAWRHALFARLLKDLGVREIAATTKQLSILFDGVAVYASIEGDKTAARAARKVVEVLIDAQLAAKKGKKS